MTLPDFQRRKLAILSPMVRALARLLGLASGSAIAPAQFRDLVDATTELVNSSRDRLAEAAFELYLELRPADGGDFGAAPTLNPLPPLYLAKVIETYRDDLESEDHSAAAVSRIVQGATGTVENAGREMVQAAVRIDGVAAGWARVLTGEESCGWCAMLASRGPVFKSKDGALKSRRHAGSPSDAWHPGCDCIAVPVFKGREKSWPGYEEYRKLSTLWEDVAEGKSGKAALRAFKATFEGRDVGEHSPLSPREDKRATREKRVGTLNAQISALEKTHADLVRRSSTDRANPKALEYQSAQLERLRKELAALTRS